MPLLVVVVAACSISPARPDRTSGSPSPAAAPPSSSQPATCNGRDVSVTAGSPPPGPQNTVHLAIRVSNTTPHPCVVNAAPAVRFDNGGDLVNRDATADPAFVLGPLDPGANKAFTLRWVVPPQCQTNHAAPIDGITVTIAGAAHELRARNNYGTYCWVDEIAMFI